jgi:septal ring factor EnvC (AmiA/AmiB activator)
MQPTASPDSELIRQAKLVAQVLSQATSVLRSSSSASSVWEDVAADVEELKQVENALFGVETTLKAMRESLSRIVYESRHQADHYEAIVMLLERQKASVSAQIRQHKTNRLGVLASQTRVRRAIGAETLLVEKKPENVPLYREEELQARKSFSIFFFFFFFLFFFFAFC